MEHYHYLNYEQPIGEHLKLLVDERPTHRVSDLEFGAAPPTEYRIMMGDT